LVHNELLTISAQELGILHFKRKKLGQLDVWSPLLWPKHLLNSHSHLNCPPGLSHCFVSSEFLLLKKKKRQWKPRNSGKDLLKSLGRKGKLDNASDSGKSVSCRDLTLTIATFDND
jgi:hypothetical protein